MRAVGTVDLMDHACWGSSLSSLGPTPPGLSGRAGGSLFFNAANGFHVRFRPDGARVAFWVAPNVEHYEYTPAYDGNRNTVWRTAPLWGVGSGFPWGHDGASLTLEDVILRHALGLGDDTEVNLSGGPLTGSPFMAVGLTRVIELARAIRNGAGRRGVAHASSGPALQQNLLCVLEGDS